MQLGHLLPNTVQLRCRAVRAGEGMDAFYSIASYMPKLERLQFDGVFPQVSVDRLLGKLDNLKSLVIAPETLDPGGLFSLPFLVKVCLTR
jgi:hypothetical protein